MLGLLLSSFIFHNHASAKELHLFAGAGLRQPVDQLVQEFEKETGNKILTDFGGSGQLMTKIQTTSKGDLFIPGALFYLEKLEKAGIVQSYSPIAAHTPVIGVNIKQSRKVTSFDDLAKPGVRLAMGDPKAMALGKTAMSICEKSGQKAAILKNVTVYGATVKQLSMYVSQGVVDASIIGRADAFQNRDKIAMVSIPEAYFQSETIAVAILKHAQDSKEAKAFAEYMSSTHAVEVFKAYGFLPLEK
jgi:molybdate transport system substrate-binding protein